MSEASATAGMEPVSLGRIFEEQAPYVWRVLRRLGVPESDVEDVCQEVFLVIHRRLADFEGRSALTTWIYGICVRKASDFRRRAHRRREIATDEVPEGRISAPQIEEAHRRAALQRLDEALSSLDENKRAVFVLYEIEGLSMPEVAETLGCPVQTAYSRLHAARARVRKHMEPAAEGGAS